MNKVVKIKSRVVSLISKEKEIANESQQRVLLVSKNNNSQNSTLFYTTHKCASSFMQKILIKLCANGSYVFNDYASAIYQLGNKLDIEQDKKNYLVNFLESNYDRLFYKKNEIYGPLRFPVDFPDRNTFKHIFFLRDPRDVIVSSYYSFGFTHSLPTNEKSKGRMLSIRKEIQQKGIDQYAIDFADELVQRYIGFKNLKENCDSFIYLKYDDFTNNTKAFILNLSQYLNVNLSDNELKVLCYEASPIQKNIKKESHKRSGKNGQYVNELKPETQAILNEKFKTTLLYWKFKS